MEPSFDKIYAEAHQINKKVDQLNPEGTESNQQISQSLIDEREYIQREGKERKKISETSPRFEAYLASKEAVESRERSSVYFQIAGVFGGRVLAKLDTVRKRFRNIGREDLPEPSKTIYERGLEQLQELQLKLSAQIASEGSSAREHSGFFVAELINHPKIKKELPPLPDDRQEDLSAIVRAMPLPTFERLLRLHQAGFEKREKLFHKLIPVLKATFVSNVTTLAVMRELPAGMKLETVKRRMERTKVFLCDSTTSNLEQLMGAYDGHSESMAISENLVSDLIQRQAEEARKGGSKKSATTSVGALKEYLQGHFEELPIYHTYVHEMVHALAGRTIMGKEKRGEIKEIDTVREGMDFGGKDRAFGWINEAITEAITMYLVGPNMKIGSYRAERKLLFALLEKGKKHLVYRNFFEAYFESLDPDQDPDKRIPAYRALISDISEAYCPQFLVKLNQFVQKNGAKAALKALDDWEEKIVNNQGE